MIEIKSKEKFININNINTIIIDVSLNNSRFNPKFPWGDIPIPYSYGYYGISLFGIWEGLKVFEKNDIDVSFFEKTNIHNLPRTELEYGKFKGFRRGMTGQIIFSEDEARERIYIPTYRWILEHKVCQQINYLRFLTRNKEIILLDENEHYNIKDTTKPLSTAFLLKSYLEGIYPYEDVVKINIRHHYYCGRKFYSWTSYEKIFKEIPPKDCEISQLEIDFDY